MSDILYLQLCPAIRYTLVKMLISGQQVRDLLIEFGLPHGIVENERYNSVTKLATCVYKEKREVCYLHHHT